MFRMTVSIFLAATLSAHAGSLDELLANPDDPPANSLRNQMADLFDARQHPDLPDRIDYDLTFDAQTEDEARAEHLTFMGREAFRTDRPTRARILFEEAAKLGSAPAYANLGWMHLSGAGQLTHDYRRSIEMLRRAAESGNPRILTMFAAALLNSPNIAEKPELRAKGMSLLETASYLGDLRASFMLAWQSFAKEPKDMERFEAAVQRVWEGGESKYRLEIVKLFMNQSGTQDHARTRRMLEEIGSDGHAYIWKYYRDGLGGSKDVEKAAQALLSSRIGDLEGFSPTVWTPPDPKDYSPEFNTELKKVLNRAGLFDGPIDGQSTKEFRRALVMYPFQAKHFHMNSIYEDFGHPRLEELVRDLIIDERLLRTITEDRHKAWPRERIAATTEKIEKLRAELSLD
ncbi:MAG: hypothetical protein AAF557_09010 [Pseudomonadota bacterium]